MTGEGGVERLLGLFEDLEQQAEGLTLQDRDLEVAELSRSEYSEVELASRLHASLGREVVVAVRAVGDLPGRVGRVGPGWLLLEDDAAVSVWVVRTAEVLAVSGLSERALPEAARPVTARVGLGSVLARLASARVPVRLHHLDGRVRTGLLRRVGADFAELQPVEADEVRRQPLAVPFSGLAAVRAQRDG
jgi:hypothetical protein